MLTALELENFKCFPEHHVPLRPVTALVGRNNAGKSTIVEALHLISIVVARYRSLNFFDAPSWLDAHHVSQGVSPSLKGLDFNLRTAFSHYGDPPAVIRGHFSSGHIVSVFIGEDEELHAELRLPDGRPVMNKAQAHVTSLPRVEIQPQVRPLLLEERLLDERYIRSMLSSTLAPAHFRNQLYWLDDDMFTDFADIAESTWPGLTVEEITESTEDGVTLLNLLVRDGDFVAEVGWMGHGLQMWLQTMWFLARVHAAPTVILDEPDVYMHADLQRRLMRFIRGRHEQVIVATHSLEIMSEIEPDEVLVVDRSRRESRFASSVKAVQRVVEQMGAVHNISLARLVGAKKCLMVEGDDLKFLKRGQALSFPHALESFDSLPQLSVGGWSGWPYAVGSSMFLLKNAAGQDIIPYCIFDSDYETPEGIAERLVEAGERKIELHVWERKEIENYFLHPAAIARTVARRAGKKARPSDDDVKARMLTIADEMRADVLSGYLGSYLRRFGPDKHKQALAAATKLVDKSWRTEDGRLARIGGKEMFSRLSTWTQDEYGVSFGVRAVTNEILEVELPDEFRRVIAAIETRQRFN